MANEVRVDALLKYDDDLDEQFDMQSGFNVTLTTVKATRHQQTVGTSEEALVLGDVSSLGWLMLKNLDTTNYIEVKTGTAGTIIGKMLAGESFGPIRVGSGITAPYVIANTASCKMAVLLTSA